MFADVLVLCGDLTDYGLPDEAHLLVEELSGASDCLSSQSWAITTLNLVGTMRFGKS